MKSAYPAPGGGSGSGPDICKRPAAGASGCGGVPARISPRSPEHPGRAHYSRSTGDMGGRIAGAVSSSCCRLRSHPPLRTGERPRDQRAMRWHDALLAPEVTVEQHRDRTPRSPMPIGARHVLSHERMRAEASVSCVMDTPSQGVHRACLVVTLESSEEASGPGTCRT